MEFDRVTFLLFLIRWSMLKQDVSMSFPSLLRCLVLRKVGWRKRQKYVRSCKEQISCRRQQQQVWFEDFWLAKNGDDARSSSSEPRGQANEKTPEFLKNKCPKLPDNLVFPHQHSIIRIRWVIIRKFTAIHPCNEPKHTCKYNISLPDSWANICFAAEKIENCQHRLWY